MTHTLQLPLKGIMFPPFIDETLNIQLNKTTVLMGRSGIGKSTLLQHLRAFLIQQNATISILQHSYNDFPWKTLAENVAMRDILCQKPQDHDRLNMCLDHVGLSDWRNHYPHQLSQGMRQRMALARLFYEDAPYILLDEPFNHLDEGMLEHLYVVFKKLFRDKTVVMTTHDRSEALLFGDQHFYLHGTPVKIEGDLP